MVKDIRALARHFQGDVAGHETILIPGPGHSPRDRSLSVTFRSDAREGFVVHSYAGDDFQDCRDHVRSRLGLGERNPCTASGATVPSSVEIDRPSDHFMRIWNSSSSPKGTPVEWYLNGRGLTLADPIAGDVIRFHRSLQCMVALFRDYRSGEACGIHRTFLDRNGRKLGRKMLGRSRWAAIKLDPDEDVTIGLAIGEGIETTLTGRLGGFRPAWVLGSAGKIGTFPLLPGVEALTVFVETNDGGASERALRQCAGRWLEAGAEVFAVTPKRGGDLNDLIKRCDQ